MWGYQPIRVQQAFRITLVVIATVALAYLLYLIGDLLLVLFIAIVFASAIRPAVEQLADWRVPKGAAAILVTVGMIAAVGGLLFFAVPPLVQMIVELFRGEALMAELDQLSARLRFFGWQSFRVILPPISLPEQLNGLLDLAQNAAEDQAWPLAEGALYTLAQIILMFVMAVYWLTSRTQALEFLLRLSPLHRRAKVREIWNDVETTLGSYTRGQLALMLVVGVACFLGLAVLGVPHAAGLALLAGLTEAIPFVGPLLGAIPAVLLGLTVSWQTALFVAAWYIIVQQLEAHLLVPRIMHRAVGLNPILVIVALIAGGTLKGVVGVLIAVPIVGALQVLARHIVLEPVIDGHSASNAPEILIPGADTGPVLESERDGSAQEKSNAKDKAEPTRLPRTGPR